MQTQRHESTRSTQLGANVDGVICIGGEDWWYHNRGHFDFQVMRDLARRGIPILFVNSLGVRMPSLTRDKAFAKRISRKLKSFSRGLVEVSPNFWVFSPISIPGRTGRQLREATLAPQIRLAAHRAGVTNPVLWVHCPAGADLIRDIPHSAVVMQRTDRFEAFPDGDRETLLAQLKTIREASDLIVYCNDDLAREDVQVPSAKVVATHGVELNVFTHAGRSRAEPDWTPPADIAAYSRPRVGFIGGVDHHTFDPDLFRSVVDRLPDYTFVVVGDCSLPGDWLDDRRNVHVIGRRPYDAIADYMAAMDVLIMPWNQSDWIKACNPIKLKEYLAVGRPVVTTPFPALAPWRPYVEVADNADDFANAIRRSAGRPHRDLTNVLSAETWVAKTELILKAMDKAVADRRCAIAHVERADPSRISA